MLQVYLGGAATGQRDCSRPFNRHKTGTTRIATLPTPFPDTTKPPINRGFSSVDLIDLYYNNSDAANVTPEQQRCWIAQAARLGAVTPAVARPYAVPRRIGPEACADILGRYVAGETAKALADEFGIARNSVLNLLREHNVVVRRQPPTVDQRVAFVTEYNTGASISEIANRHGVAFGTVQKALSAAMVSMRPRGGRGLDP